ncbi:MAG: tRNA 5-methoxyuridine(34)/uridine 5-oxyacetic acid(34) synthase CmoB [Gammaproteobacteria bacterium]|nr:tRNA 5-methoxyuridine(34)/uridine 5-oxyacetic acid(34) synthase CmoB [Gammaproteobacteria bacterium]
MDILPYLRHHGDYPDWQDAIDKLPQLSPSRIRLDTDTVQIGHPNDCSPAQRATIRQQLQRLLPWRKGPFNLFGVNIDAEWRADLKWRRLQDRITPLSGRTVLDVGCGNGYYGWRMLGVGAARVLGTDPTLRYVMQQRAVAKYLPDAPFQILPFSLEDLPEQAASIRQPPSTAGSGTTMPLLPHEGFDTVFSMGVIYHRRDPENHLRQLRQLLRPGGELVLESLIIDARHGAALYPQGRYAKMRNIRVIPSLSALHTWLSGVGFTAIDVADISLTTPAEQRVTEWTFEQSLADFLNPRNPALTIEGHPAPQRAMLICRRR